MINRMEDPNAKETWIPCRCEEAEQPVSVVEGLRTLENPPERLSLHDLSSWVNQLGSKHLSSSAIR